MEKKVDKNSETFLKIDANAFWVNFLVCIKKGVPKFYTKRLHMKIKNILKNQIDKHICFFAIININTPSSFIGGPLLKGSSS